jgi:hypothetical protein
MSANRRVVIRHVGQHAVPTLEYVLIIGRMRGGDGSFQPHGLPATGTFRVRRHKASRDDALAFGSLHDEKVHAPLWRIGLA